MTPPRPRLLSQLAVCDAQKGAQEDRLARSRIAEQTAEARRLNQQKALQDVSDINTIR